MLVFYVICCIKGLISVSGICRSWLTDNSFRAQGKVKMVSKKSNNEAVKATAGAAPESDKKRLDREYAQELAQKINFLFDNFRKPNGDRYTFSEVEQRSGGEVDQSWLWKLAHGQVTRPGLRVLKTISDFFEIDSNFWFNELDETSLARVKQDVLALRAINLSPEALQIVLNLIESLEKSGIDALKKEGSKNNRLE
jgi:transcriptional regulator with XRE-family HTH domain